MKKIAKIVIILVVVVLAVIGIRACNKSSALKIEAPAVSVEVK